MHHRDYSHLPHLDLKEHYQFITFRTKESLDPYMKKLYASTMPDRQKYYLIDKYLDTSDYGCLIDGNTASEIIAYYRQKSGDGFELVNVCAMPNHLHVLLKQQEPLSKIMQILKGGAAHIVNKNLVGSGAVWSRDYFDRAIRDERHFEITYAYIRNNPLKARLDDSELRYYGIYG